MQQKKQEKRQAEKSQPGTPTPAPAAGISRRSILKNTTALTAAATFAAMGSNFAWAQVSEEIKVGVIGAGGRASGAVADHKKATEITGIKSKIVSVCDMFAPKARGLGKKYEVPEDKAFFGLDGYKQVIDSGVDLIITATPPGFRPIHFAAAVEAGKHVFFEKPVGVDPTGIRKVIAAGKLAEEKRLTCVTGTQRRHESNYMDTIKAIHDGAIGEVLQMSIYWNGSGIWWRKREPGMTDMEDAINNWYHHIWLCGDQIVEQHVHNIDVANWVMDSTPVSAYAVGGRQVRKEPGEIWDHFAVEYEYPDDRRVMSMCRHWPNSDDRVSEFVRGAKGKSDPSGWIQATGEARKSFKGPRNAPNGYVQEHVDLLKSLKEGNPINEAKRIAETTLTAIMGRMSAYTGKQIWWSKEVAAKVTGKTGKDLDKVPTAMESKLDLMPKDLSRDAKPPELEVPEPGKTKFV